MASTATSSKLFWWGVFISWGTGVTLTSSYIYKIRQKLSIKAILCLFFWGIPIDFTSILDFLFVIKFRCSKKATKCEKNLPLKIWCYSVTSNCRWKNFVAFSVYLNFNCFPAMNRAFDKKQIPGLNWNKWSCLKLIRPTAMIQQSLAQKAFQIW